MPVPCTQGHIAPLGCHCLLTAVEVQVVLPTVLSHIEVMLLQDSLQESGWLKTSRLKSRTTKTPSSAFLFTNPSASFLELQCPSLKCESFVLLRHHLHLFPFQKESRFLVSICFYISHVSLALALSFLLSLALSLSCSMCVCACRCFCVSTSLL